MKKIFSLSLALMFLGAGCAASTSAVPTPAATPTGVAAKTFADVGGRHYYRVTTDPNLNSGTKVCASFGLKCVGYTDTSLTSCVTFHPDALTSSDEDGAKAGFYCNGPPEQGVCARERNSCHICKDCGVNMDCDTQAGTLYREMFVECK